MEGSTPGLSVSPFSKRGSMIQCALCQCRNVCSLKTFGHMPHKLATVEGIVVEEGKRFFRGKLMGREDGWRGVGGGGDGVEESIRSSHP